MVSITYRKEKMIERFKPQLVENEINTSMARDYTRLNDVARAIERLVAGLKEDGDESRMFELLGEILQRSPELLMPVLKDSISLAATRLGQERKAGSSATLLYPIDAAIR